MTQSRLGLSVVSALACLSLTFAASASPRATSMLILQEDHGAPMILARHGADDPAGDDRRGRGRGTDEGAGHA